MDRLSADDQLVLWSDATWPQDVGALLLLEGRKLVDSTGRLRIEVVRNRLEHRLDRLPRFRQVLHVPPRGLGRPVWLDAPAFDLDEHLHVTPVPAPGDDEQVVRTVARVRRDRLDPSRPLWEMWFLTGLTGGRVGLFIRLHHVMGDGMAAVAGLAALLDAAPENGDDVPVVEWTPMPWPSPAALAVDHLAGVGRRIARALAAVAHPVSTIRRMLQVLPTVRGLLTAEPGPDTSLNRLIGPDRTLDLLRAPLDRVVQIAHAHGATVNDVLLAVIAGGLQELLASRGELGDGMSVPVYVPVSLRRAGPPAGGRPMGNDISQMVVPVRLGGTDPATRLRTIAEETRRRKAAAHPPLGAVFRGRLISGLMLTLVARRRVNVLTADLPGPREPRYFCGARILEVFPLLNLIGNVSLGIGAMSYAGGVCVLLVADADAYPDLGVFTDGARRELDALVRVTPSAPSTIVA